MNIYYHKYYYEEDEIIKLQINDELDIRSMNGKFYSAKILNIDVLNPFNFLIKYIKWTDSWNEWINFRYESNRFAKKNTMILVNANRKMKNGDLVDVKINDNLNLNYLLNSNINNNSFWKSGNIVNLDNGFVQVNVKLNPYTNILYWYHSDDVISLTLPYSKCLNVKFNFRTYSRLPLFKIPSNNIIFFKSTINRKNFKIPCNSMDFHIKTSKNMKNILKYNDNKYMNFNCSENTLYALRNWFMEKVILDKKCYLDFNTLCELAEISRIWLLMNLYQYVLEKISTLIDKALYYNINNINVYFLKYGLQHNFPKIVKISLNKISGKELNTNLYTDILMTDCPCIKCQVKFVNINR